MNPCDEIQYAKNILARFKAVDEMFSMEIDRKRGQQIDEKKIASLYAIILKDKLMDALKVMSPKDVTTILSVSAQVSPKAAQAAIYELKARTKGK